MNQSMKLFLDTGNTEAIRRVMDTGLLDGVTTNPSHIAATGRPFKEVVREIATLVPGPISVEVMAETADGMVRDALEMTQIAPQINVKIPMNKEGLKAVPVLEQDKKIKTNVTMIFSSTQAYLAMKAGASFVSIVLSRLDAVANESDILVEDTMLTKINYGFDSEIIAGSVKTQNHMMACLRTGIDIATIPESLFFQMFKHPLTESGLAQFKIDWESVPK